MLREVVGGYLGNRPESLYVLSTIKDSAEDMVQALQVENVARFAQLLSEHWELSNMLDKGCTNTCIEQILSSVEDLVDGCMICGAGGGGFLQVMLRSGVTKAMLQEKLAEVFQDSGAAVWESEFVWE